MAEALSYWYGSGGEILAETSATGATLNEYIFFSGKRVAMLPAGGNPEYYAEDFLGSYRVTTTNTGAVCYDADSIPTAASAPTPTAARPPMSTNSKAKNATPRPATTTSEPATTPTASAAGSPPTGPTLPFPSPMPISPTRRP